jgi:uncharacterized membrane protein YfcA
MYNGAPQMTMASFLLLSCAAFVAGVMNSIAGGGSFLTFPALVFTGVPSIVANASSTVALFPGTAASAWAYRHDLKRSGTFPFWPAAVMSLVGGILGALLLLSTPQRTFDSIVPWLLLAATLVFAFGPRVSAALRGRFHVGPATVIVAQLPIAIYGGYFGGAIGILMLAVWAAYGMTDIHVMNANKTILGGVLNSIAALLFIVAGKVWWPQALTMLVAAVIGGYLGAHGARRTPPQYVRAAILVISVSITAAFFFRTYAR